MTSDEMRAHIEQVKKRKRYPVLNSRVLGEIPNPYLVQAILDHIFDVKVRGDYPHRSAIIGQLSLGFRIIHATWLVEVEVYNGGYQQFFQNWGEVYAQDAIDGFRLIGAPRSAVLTEEAVSVYHKAQPFRLWAGITGLIDKLKRAERYTALDELDGQFYDTGEHYRGLQIAYIRSHLDEFVSE